MSLGAIAKESPEIVDCEVVYSLVHSPADMPKKRKPSTNAHPDGEKTMRFEGDSWSITKVLGIIASALAVAGGLIIGLSFYLKPDIAKLDQKLTSQSETISKLETGLAKTNDKIDGLLNEALKRAFALPNPKVAAIPDINKLRQGNEIIELANRFNIRIDPNTLNTFGQYALSATARPALSQVAWKAANSSLTQRADQTEVIGAISQIQWRPAPLPSEGIRQTFQLPQRVLQGLRTYESSHIVRREDCWYSVVIGSEKLANLQPSNCAEYAKITSAGEGHHPTPELDGNHFRNVIFENVTIVYHGGPLILENVIFVKCSFNFGPGQGTHELGMSFFKKPWITFTNVG